MDPVIAAMLILVLAIAAFVSNRVPLALVAIGVSLDLFFAGVMTLPQALAGFGDPIVLFVAALFVVSESLDATAVSVAATLGLSVQPFMMALTVAGAASFLTPIATPANLMVFEPGGYRFGDYGKLGLPLALLFIAVAVLYVPLIWHF